MPQLALVVWEVTCTVMLPPEATVAGPQVRVWVGAVPVIEQLLAGVLESIDQFTPVPPGSGSLIETPVAEPAPVFVRVTVNPMSEPALTEALSAVLVIVRSGQFTVVEAESFPAPSFVLVNDAVLS